MKKSELQQIIKEEISKILNEEDPIQTSFNKKLNLPEPSSEKNTLRPKSIEIEFGPGLGKIYRILRDGKSINVNTGKELIKKYTGIDISSGKNTNILTQISDKLKDKKINFEYSEVDRF